MELSEFTIRILFLFLPGIVSTIIIDAFTVHKKWESYRFFLLIFLYSVFSYLLYGIALKILSLLGVAISTDAIFLNALFNKTIEISLCEIVWAILISIFIALLTVFLDSNKYLYKLVQKIKITYKFGELGVWGYSFNMVYSNSTLSWVTVRDMKHDLIYDGWVQAVSDDSVNMELLLRDVSIYSNENAEPLYQVGAMYVSRDINDLRIEFREVPVSESRKWSSNENLEIKIEDDEKNGNKST